MKLKYLKILIITIFISGCSQNDNVENCQNEMNVFGKVKSLKESYFKAYLNFGKITKGEKSDYGRDVLFLFNEKGKIVEKNEYFKDESLLFKWLYKYNKKGFLIEQDIFDIYGNCEFINLYKYDIYWNLIEKDSIPVDSNNICKTIYKNNANGNIVELKKYLWGGKYLERRTLKNDSNGKIVEENQYFSEKNIDRDTFDSEILVNKLIYKYDDKGNESAVYIYDDSNLNTSKWISKYEYDDNNNWVKKIIYINDELTYMIERKYEYYK